jgi:hypothetical protein
MVTRGTRHCSYSQLSNWRAEGGSLRRILSGWPGGLNAYGFASDDRLNYSDPFGLCPPEQRGNCTQGEASSATIRAGRIVAAAGLVASTNDIPATFARVVPGHLNPTTLAKAGEADAFVTDATAVRGLNAAQISERLGIPESPSGYKVIEFPSSRVSGVASPINRMNPGFVGRGVTSGGAPEYVVPNGPIPEGAVTTEVVEIPIEIPITPVP